MFHLGQTSGHAAKKLPVIDDRKFCATCIFDGEANEMIKDRWIPTSERLPEEA